MDSKLCPRQTTRFKRSSTRDSKTLATSLATREETFVKKASELSTLCDIDVCVLYYNRDGYLIKTWPEDKAKVKDMAVRYSQLSEREKHKKNTNLSECLAKKTSQEKKIDFDKYSQKLIEMEDSLEQRLPILEDHVRLLEDQSRKQWTEPLTNPLSKLPKLQDKLQSLSVPSDCGIPQPLMDLPTSLIDDPSHQQWTEPLVHNRLRDLPSKLSLNHHDDQTKFSIFLVNHDNGNFTQLGSNFDQSFNDMSNTGLLGAQGFGSCNNIIADLPPPLMQTQNPLPQCGQYASWNQTLSFGDPMMMFSSSYV